MLKAKNAAELAAANGAAKPTPTLVKPAPAAPPAPAPKAAPQPAQSAANPFADANAALMNSASSIDKLVDLVTVLAKPAPAAAPAPAPTPSPAPVRPVLASPVRSTQPVPAAPAAPKKMEAIVHRDSKGRMERVVITII
jgi:hypothetical protein